MNETLLYIPHVVLCLVYQRERMAYQNLSSNPYIVMQWCSDTICEITSVVMDVFNLSIVQQCLFLDADFGTNAVATVLNNGDGAMCVPL